MLFKTIEAVEAHRWVGNHAADSAAFDGVNLFLLRTGTDRAIQRRAFRVISENAMGEPYIEQTDAQVDVEMDELRDVYEMPAVAGGAHG